MTNGRAYRKSIRFGIIISCLAVLAALGGITIFGSLVASERTRGHDWETIPPVVMGGGLRIFWNVVGEGRRNANQQAAYSRGFEPVVLLNTYADYPGEQKENIYKAVGTKHDNPWQTPEFFERIIRRNIERLSPVGIYVHDIELSFEESAARAWQSEEVRRASHAATPEAFEEAYFRKWAEWFWLPVAWTRETYPGVPIGLYGPQPFRRDYWGISGSDAAQFDGAHKSDGHLWKFIDPHVDFYIASIYVFYDRPDSVFYMAANVEENYLRTRPLGVKPVYAYTWLRFHDSNWWRKGDELTPYLVEAMAIVPYFSGAKGVVLWGWEPQLARGGGQPYENLPLFVRSLNRVAAVSERIGRGHLVIDKPAHEAWKAQRPLIRKVVVSEDECVVMAIDPWQSEASVGKASTVCGGRTIDVPLRGRHITILSVDSAGIREH